MRALHIAAKNKNARHDKRMFGQHGRRFVSLLLCIGMIIPMLLYFGGFSFSDSFGATKYAMNRKADKDTMDDYINQLLSMNFGSRYAGRIWTDKSVFAFKDGGPNLLNLLMTTDGYKGQVGYNADFLHVFSALASSQVVNEWPPSPIDLVIVFDMSASMGQDTRYSLDGGTCTFTQHSNTGDSVDWPAEGVLMSERIENSRIQLTLDAINNTIDKLMEQNPENRVAVCCYGANATVILPLAHYKHALGADGQPDKTVPFLKVGGMETLYHPGDLVWRNAGEIVGERSVAESGWYWINNRDTAYTVEAHAMKNEDVSPCSMKTLSDPASYSKYDKIISNNVKNDGVKAFPGVEDPTKINTASDVIKTASQNINQSSDDYGAKSDNLINAVKPTQELKADDYVGYFTNTQGGIYLAYKQLADSTATTYTDRLSDGKDNTVARIPAVIIMSDGGANFAFNRMGKTVDDWNLRYGAHLPPEKFETNRDSWYIGDDTWGPKLDENDNYVEDQVHGAGNDVPGREEDYNHRLNNNRGDEWWDVYLPGDDTLEPGKVGRTTEDGKWDGLHTLYNVGADYYQDGTLNSPAGWSHPGVFYSNDVDWMGTPATILEVLLTASYMKQVATKHYETGWEAEKASPDSQSTLSTYTMNVDTANLPQWARWRLFPTLDPKNYPPDGLLDKVDADPARFAYQYGSENYGEGDLGQINLDGSYYGSTIRQLVFGAIEREWGKLVEDKCSVEAMGTQDRAYAKMDMTASAYAYKGIAVSADEILNNVAYNDKFVDVTSTEMEATFERILSEITGNVFVPVSGENDSGVSNSITYQDPLGEYMEIKNQAITATTHGNSTSAAYDMALLLFGQMHGLVRAGVYDWNWNDEWMRLHPDYGLHGQTAFPQGWYKGSPSEAADAPLGEEFLITKDYDSYPSCDYPNTSKKYNSAEEARADGWVMRFSFSTLIQFVPIVNAPESGLPEDLSEQVKNTVYTCYRFAGDAQERNKLRINPVFGESVPADAAAEWDEYFKVHGAYPDTNEFYSKYPGVYRNSDIRVWIEDTGDFVDSDGAITPNAGYDRSLYVNIPASAVPTQLATVTLGPDGVSAYQTNLATDKGIEYDDETKGANLLPEDKKLYEACAAQSTPLRLFYAVGLEEDLILRDEKGEQIGVDFSKISPEYITNHTVGEQNYVWFISNYYSATTYDDYASETGSATRGDPTMTFSPSIDNRYYIFQKPLPLYAHAYTFDEGGNLHAVDKTDKGIWAPETKNEGGNGKEQWGDSTVTGGGMWAGGEFMGTYENAAEFAEAQEEALKPSPDKNGFRYITDSTGTKYVYSENGIIFLEEDLMDHVTSDENGAYTENSTSFSSDDYFFLTVEYYLPIEGTVGKEADSSEDIPNSFGGRKVQRVVARKGSEFGSGFASDEIDNGDMLCWSDMNGLIDITFEYMSKSDTDDRTRGEPTLEKLTKKGRDLKEYLKTTCGIREDTMMDNPDYNPDEDPIGDNTEKISVLDWLTKYWEGIQENAQVKARLQEAVTKYNAGDASNLTEQQFGEYFSFAVSAKPGGIRSGDMANNRHAKVENVTKTAQNYYVPVVSENSGIGDEVILNNYMGNNGYLEIANQMLHVTKMLEAPEGFKLSQEQLNERFNYQIYVQGVTGIRNATVTKYNEYAGVWERELAYIDVLTDNSSLVMDNQSRRAVFIKDTINGSLTSPVQTAKMVVEYNGDYYEANEDGTLPMTAAGVVDESKKVDKSTPLYYLYLPSINTGSETELHVRRLYQNKEYDGTADGYVGTDDMFRVNGVTTFVDDAHSDMVTPAEPGAANRDSYRLATYDRPAGTRTYWAQDAELIPIDEVQAVENASGNALTPSTFTLMSAPGGVWQHQAHEEGIETGKGHIELHYYNLVIRRPEGETSATAFVSPLSTRSQYMTVELKFGINSNNNDGGPGTKGETLTSADLYDGIIPTVDRPDLFSNTNKNSDSQQIAANTAEFTLRHGEGLLLTGLDNRIAYRFTEKLTDEQLKQGYTLKRISHVQQRGSDTVYMPGAQEVPVYQTDDGTLTWAIDSDGQENSTATKVSEPFAHTNATIWESYSTMAAGVSGNHHQPQASEGVAINPSCLKQLNDGGCDLLQDDGTTRHYFYHDGKLVDPHYEGEAEWNFRYVLNPTAHFGIDGETGEQANKLDYNGVYSVYGNTGWFEEQVNYTNTWDPDALTISKTLEAEEGDALSKADMDKKFEYTVTFTLPDWLAATSAAPATDANSNVLDTLTYWQGKTADIDKLVADGGAPRPYDKDAIAALRTELGVKKTRDGKSQYEYTFILKADESIVIYGLPAQTTYTVTEKRDEDYPLKGETDSQDLKYSADGTIRMSKRILGGTVTENQFVNKISYVNEKVKKTGSLSIEKQIANDSPDLNKEFSFTVTITAPSADEGEEGKFLVKDEITVVLTKSNKTEDPRLNQPITVNWTEEKDAQDHVTKLTCTVELSHGEQVTIYGIPFESTYSVSEAQTAGYNLQKVQVNNADVEGPVANGTISENAQNVTVLFQNTKAIVMPLTGGKGSVLFYLLGTVLLAAPTTAAFFAFKKKTHNA